MRKTIALSILAITLAYSAYADEVTVAEPIKQCSSTQSDGAPFKYQIIEIFDGLIFADYNVDTDSDQPFNRLFKELDDGSLYYRGADQDSLMELTIQDYYTFTNTNLVTETVIFNYSNPNKCKEITVTKTLRYHDEAVKDHCDRKWTKRGERDDRMFDHCVKTQAKGFEEIKDALVEYKGTPFIANMFINLIDTWTERDFTDYRLIASELRDNGESYLNIEWELNNADDEVRPILRTHLIYTFNPKNASYRSVEREIEDDR